MLYKLKYLHFAVPIKGVSIFQSEDEEEQTFNGSTIEVIIIIVIDHQTDTETVDEVR